MFTRSYWCLLVCGLLTEVRLRGPKKFVELVDLTSGFGKGEMFITEFVVKLVTLLTDVLVNWHAFNIFILWYAWVITNGNKFSPSFFVNYVVFLCGYGLLAQYCPWFHYYVVYDLGVPFFMFMMGMKRLMFKSKNRSLLVVKNPDGSGYNFSLTKVNPSCPSCTEHTFSVRMIYVFIVFLLFIIFCHVFVSLDLNLAEEVKNLLEYLPKYSGTPFALPPLFEDELSLEDLKEITAMSDGPLLYIM